MDGEQLRDRSRRLAAWLDATPAEVAGLAMLLAGALAVLGMLWWSGRPVPVRPDPVAPAPTGSDLTAGDGAEALPAEVTVHVAGAVARPGVVRLPDGARVADAIDATGGLVVDADPSALNLARPLTDGERLDVPRVGETTTPPGAAYSSDGTVDGDGGAVRPDGRLDLNRATASELETLPGVGPVLAGRIVDWREANGPFTEVGQLREVAGIGETTFQALAELVAV